MKRSAARAAGAVVVLAGSGAAVVVKMGQQPQQPLNHSLAKEGVHQLNEHQPQIMTHHNLNYGDKDCPCIGFSQLDGDTLVKFGDHVEAYPSDLGSYCTAWDNGRHPSCKAGDAPGYGNGFCGQSWCYVDSCNCKLNILPKLAVYVPDATYSGRPVFFSYATCGARDLWTQEVPKIGKAKCTCIGFDNIPGTTDIKLKGKDGKELTVSYPAEIGGTCEAWDNDRHPECKGGKDEPAWCKERWCFVDPCACDIGAVPRVTTYLPHATFTGKSLYYSYETCGSKDHFTEKWNKEACVNQNNEKDCLSMKRGGHDKCAWTGSKCLGWEIMAHPLCGHLRSGVTELRRLGVAAIVVSALSVLAH